MVPLDHVPSQGEFVQFFTKERLTGINDSYMQRQIQKHSILKISDLLNKLVIYRNLYSVSRGNCCQRTTGKHTYFHAHCLNKRDNNKRHRTKFIPALLQPSLHDWVCISTATVLGHNSSVSSSHSYPALLNFLQYLTLVPCGREFFWSIVLYKVFSYTVCKILPSEISALSLWDSNSV